LAIVSIQRHPSVPLDSWQGTKCKVPGAGLRTMKTLHLHLRHSYLMQALLIHYHRQRQSPRFAASVQLAEGSTRRYGPTRHLTKRSGGMSNSVAMKLRPTTHHHERLVSGGGDAERTPLHATRQVCHTRAQSQILATCMGRAPHVGDGHRGPHGHPAEDGRM
jgi:hypothetical protein